MNTIVDHEQIAHQLATQPADFDVAIVLLHDSGMRRLVPHWECSLTPSELAISAASEAIVFLMQMGTGTVDWFIWDNRHADL